MNSPPFDISKFHRYVAIGDSQTEGLHDYDAHGVPRGWADRFAERLAEHNPGLLYANLAVRGKRTAEIRDGQLAAAIALEPDLVTVVSGVNDVVRPNADVDGVASDIESMYAAFAREDCTVMGCTFPLPATGLTRKVVPRLKELNSLLRVAADRRGVLLVELEDIEAAADLRLWNADRIHLNSDGHQRLGAAFAGTLEGVDREKWMEPALPPAPERNRAVHLAHEAAWVAQFVVPKIFRMLRGRSSGDGRSAKRPELKRVVDLDSGRST